MSQNKAEIYLQKHKNSTQEGKNSHYLITNQKLIGMQKEANATQDLKKKKKRKPNNN